MSVKLEMVDSKLVVRLLPSTKPSKFAVQIDKRTSKVKFVKRREYRMQAIVEIENKEELERFLDCMPKIAKPVVFLKSGFDMETLSQYPDRCITPNPDIIKNLVLQKDWL